MDDFQEAPTFEQRDWVAKHRDLVPTMGTLYGFVDQTRSRCEYQNESVTECPLDYTSLYISRLYILVISLSTLCLEVS